MQSDSSMDPRRCLVHGLTRVEKFSGPYDPNVSNARVSWWECPLCMAMAGASMPGLMSTPEPPAPTPSATTCRCGHEHPTTGSRVEDFCYAPIGPVAERRAVCGCKSFRPVPPASAPAATAGRCDIHRHEGPCSCRYCVLEGCFDDPRPAAPSGEEAELVAYAQEHAVGYGIESKLCIAYLAQVSNHRRDLEFVYDALDNNNDGEALAFVRGRLGALPDALTAQATELAARREEYDTEMRAAKSAHERTYRAWEAERAEKDAELAALRARVDHVTELHDLDDWHEDDGVVLWWRLPVDEPPYCGTPLDTDWPGYHTCWTVIPEPRAALTPHQTTGDEHAT